MNDVDIRRLDASLLLVLASLLRTRQATATAQLLGVTQSSVSHSLAKLRDVFGDELFLRRPQGLEPTARAMALRPTVDRVLDLLRDAVRDAPFEPATAQGLVSIASTDYPGAVLVAPLLERLDKEAPGVRASVRPLVRREAIAALLSGDVDFAVGPFAGAEPRLEKRALWQDDYLVAARKGHPVFARACTLADYCAARHVLVSQSGDLEGVVDAVLAARQRARRVIAAVPSFLTALTIVARSDAIVTMPALIAKAHARDLGLKLFPCPVPVRRLKVNLVARAQAGRGPLNAWLSDLIVSVAGEQTSGGEQSRRPRMRC
ncbi:MAG: LysR family transcriptional regulator [Alphaproteobacteria bacterium]|nr:LysR family transcriptional regulator [Alphaproteobacteria bacterium]